MPRKTAPPADPLVTPQELADELRVPLNTIWQWRTRGTGPASFKVGRHVRYRRSEINRWRREQGDTAIPADAAAAR
jgi:excisionase family DNA binding protein